MFRFLLILFILVPIIEIGVFIQVGDRLGLVATIAIVIITAIIGVNLLKQQGFVAIRDIQNSFNQGQMPALELAAGAQLLFAGGLLLTPGFVTDVIGFLLMVPAIRMSLARFLVSRVSLSNINTTSSQFGGSSFHSFKNGHSQNSHTPTHHSQDSHSQSNKESKQGRVIEGELAQDDTIDHQQDK